MCYKIYVNKRPLAPNVIIIEFFRVQSKRFLIQSQSQALPLLLPLSTEANERGPGIEVGSHCAWRESVFCYDVTLFLPYKGSHWSKGFLTTNDHVTGDICQNSWLKEVTSQLMPLTASQAFGAFGKSILNMAFNLMRSKRKNVQLFNEAMPQMTHLNNFTLSDEVNQIGHVCVRAKWPIWPERIPVSVLLGD